MYKKEKKEFSDNISNYENYKILYKLAKPHSPQTIVFLEDKDDPWFVIVKYYQTKSGKIKDPKDSFTILQTELNDRINGLLKLGYIKK